MENIPKKKIEYELFSVSSFQRSIVLRKIIEINKTNEVPTLIRVRFTSQESSKIKNSYRNSPKSKATKMKNKLIFFVFSNLLEIIYLE